MSVSNKENRSQHTSRQKVLHNNDRRKTTSSSHYVPPHKQSKGCSTRSGRIDCPWRNGGNQEDVHGQILDPHECSEEAKEWWSERYGYEYGYRFAYEDIVDDEMYIATICGATTEEEVSFGLDNTRSSARPLPSLDLMGMAKVKTKKFKPKDQSNEFEVIYLPQVITVPEEDALYYDAFPPVRADSDSDCDLGYADVDEWEDLDDFDFGEGHKKRGKQAVISYAQAAQLKAG